MTSVAFATHLDNEPLATGTHKGASGSLSLYDPGANFWSCGVTVGLSICKIALEELETTYLTDENGNRIVTEYGQYIILVQGGENEEGLVTARDEDNVTASGITMWNRGDTYEIYKTGTKYGFISRIATDRLRGKKVIHPKELNAYGWFLEDADIDRDEHGNIVKRKDRPFGPGQPENPHRRHR